jgi:hypothetical protein
MHLVSQQQLDFPDVLVPPLADRFLSHLKHAEELMSCFILPEKTNN